MTAVTLRSECYRPASQMQILMDHQSLHTSSRAEGAHRGGAASDAAWWSSPSSSSFYGGMGGQAGGSSSADDSTSLGNSRGALLNMTSPYALPPTLGKASEDQEKGAWSVPSWLLDRSSCDAPNSHSFGSIESSSDIYSADALEQSGSGTWASTLRSAAASAQGLPPAHAHQSAARSNSHRSHAQQISDNWLTSAQDRSSAMGMKNQASVSSAGRGYGAFGSSSSTSSGRDEFAHAPAATWHSREAPLVDNRHGKAATELQHYNGGATAVGGPGSPGGRPRPYSAFPGVGAGAQAGNSGGGNAPRGGDWSSLFRELQPQPVQPRPPPYSMTPGTSSSTLAESRPYALGPGSPSSFLHHHRPFGGGAGAPGAGGGGGAGGAPAGGAGAGGHIPGGGHHPPQGSPSAAAGPYPPYGYNSHHYRHDGGDRGGVGGGVGVIGGESGVALSQQAALLARAEAEARRSRMDIYGRVVCFTCDRTMRSYAALEQHLASKHDGYNSQQRKYLEVHQREMDAQWAAASMRRHYFSLGDAISALPARGMPRGDARPGATAAAHAAFLLGGARRQVAPPAAAAAAGMGHGYQQQQHPYGSGGWHPHPHPHPHLAQESHSAVVVNPNIASSTALIQRRGKERLTPKKKKVSALKKVILRERAARAGLAVEGGGAGGVAGGPGKSPAEEEEDGSSSQHDDGSSGTAAVEPEEDPDPEQQQQPQQQGHLPPIAAPTSGEGVGVGEAADESGLAIQAMLASLALHDEDQEGLEQEQEGGPPQLSSYTRAWLERRHSGMAVADGVALLPLDPPLGPAGAALPDDVATAAATVAATAAVATELGDSALACAEPQVLSPGGSGESSKAASSAGGSAAVAAAQGKEGREGKGAVQSKEAAGVRQALQQLMLAQKALVAAVQGELRRSGSGSGSGSGSPPPRKGCGTGGGSEGGEAASCGSQSPPPLPAGTASPFARTGGEPGDGNSGAGGASRPSSAGSGASLTSSQKRLLLTGGAGVGGGPHLLPLENDSSRPRPNTYIGPDVRIRYCNQIITAELNRVTSDLLKELLRFQERARAKDPLKAKKKRRLVVGLREVSRAVRTKRAKCIIVAPNIEEITTEGGLDSTLDQILQQAEENEVTVVFALTKSRIAQAFGRRVRMSTVAICDYDGANDLYKEMVTHAQRGREEWQSIHGAQA